MIKSYQVYIKKKNIVQMFSKFNYNFLNILRLKQIISKGWLL